MTLKLNPLMTKIEKNKILILSLLSVFLFTVFYVAMQGNVTDAKGIFKTGGMKVDFMKDIIEGMKWLVAIGIVIFSLVQFFTKGSRDLNLSEFIVHLIITLIIAWLGYNFVDLVTKGAGAEVNAETESIKKTEHTKNVPDDIVEYVTPLGIVQQ